MSQGTDLFNTPDGQYSDYTTLIGGEPPQTSNWFYEGFESLSNISQTSGVVDVSLTGLFVTGQPTSNYGFQLQQNSSLGDFVAIMEYSTGTNSTDFTIGLYGRVNSLDAEEFLIAKTNNLAKEIQIVKMSSGVVNVLAYLPISPLSADQTYWIVMIAVGDRIRCEHWAQDPRLYTTPLNTVDYKFTSSSEYANFSSPSSVGVAAWVPIAGSARIRSIEVGNAFADNTDVTDVVNRQRHVDIRDFVNYRYPTRYRTIKELNTFHVTEKAHSQSIVLDTNPAGGHFSILYYPSDNDPLVPITIGPFRHDESDANLRNLINASLNSLPKFSNTLDDPVFNVVNNLAEATPTLLVEFNFSFGDLSLLEMYVGDLTPPIQSIEHFDIVTSVGSFRPTSFDQKYIQTADPNDPYFTVDDLRIEYKQKDENWAIYSSGLTPPSTRKFQGNDLSIGKILAQGNKQGLVLNFARAMSSLPSANWSAYLCSTNTPVNCLRIANGLDSASLSVSMVFANYPWDPASGASVIDTGSCSLQFTCQKDGLFSDQNGDSAYDSSAVLFEEHMLFGPDTEQDVEFKADLSEFTTGSGASFTFSTITGVRIYLKGAINGGIASSIAIMSIRCIDNSIVDGKQWLTAEINTLEQTVQTPVLDHTQAIVQTPPMIGGRRLDTVQSDVSPIDSKQSTIFQTGRDNLQDPQPTNRLMTFAREQEFDNMPNTITGPQKSSWLTSEYGFSMSDAYFKCYKTLRVRSSSDIYWDVHPGGIFESNYEPTSTPVTQCTETTKPGSPSIGDFIFTTDTKKFYTWGGTEWSEREDPNARKIGQIQLLKPETSYEFVTKFESNRIGVQINELTSAEQPLRTIYDADSCTSEKWTAVMGRIGWYFEFADKDLRVSSFDLDSASYASLITKPFLSETPIEGGQLFTSDSGFRNLFESFRTLNNEDRITTDNQKTSSRTGSYAFQSTGIKEYPGITSNEFEVHDWNHLYIEFDVWVPKRLNTRTLRPKLLLVPSEQPASTSGLDIFSGVVPSNAPLSFDFIPNAWSSHQLDFRNINAKNGKYRLVILSDGDGNPEVSIHADKWWIDNVKINMQTIEWELRAIENGSWSPFRGNVNKQYGALHLSGSLSGRHIQLQARALTEDAWVAEYTFIPKYAGSGLIVRTP